MHYPATLTPHQDGSGRYDVTFVDLPGCVSQGNNLEHALKQAEEALALHVAGMLHDGEHLPEPSTVDRAREMDEEEARTEGEVLVPGTIHQVILVREPKEEAAAPVRLSISLKPSVLAGIDAMAEEMGLTRSGLIAVATRDYISRARS